MTDHVNEEADIRCGLAAVLCIQRLRLQFFQRALNIDAQRSADHSVMTVIRNTGFDSIPIGPARSEADHGAGNCYFYDLF